MVGMTKRLKDLFDRVQSFPDAQQEAIALEMEEVIDAWRDDTPVPEWHKAILLERRRQREASPDDLIPLDVVFQRLEKRRRPSC